MNIDRGILKVLTFLLCPEIIVSRIPIPVLSSVTAYTDISLSLPRLL